MTKQSAQKISKGSVYEARMMNTRKLVSTLSSSERKGQAVLAEKLCLPISYVSHVIGLNPKKRIDETTAREIEDAFQKPDFWLDQFHEDDLTRSPSPQGNPKEKTEEMERISERLATLNRKWADLARALGTNDQSIYNWRTRDGGIPKAHLVATARFLECSIDWLLTGMDATEKATSAPENNSNSIAIVLVEKLTDAHRRIGFLEQELKQKQES